MWKQQVISILRDLYKSGELKLPSALKDFTSYTAFNSWLNFLYAKSWVVHLQKKSKDHHRNIKYLGRYLKRPPMAETRIKDYDGENVTYSFLDHHDHKNTSVTLPVVEFIKRLIMHIPDQHFRLIRYYNWLSNRTRAKLLPLVYKLVNQTMTTSSNITWQSMFQKTFGRNPLDCQGCKLLMVLTSVLFPKRSDLINNHQELATTSV